MKSPNKFITTAISALAFIASVYSQPTDNVVAYYPFNGNANDVTGNGKNATVTGATLTADRLGKANAAYSFNGSSNLIYLPNPVLPGNTAFAISLWFQTNGNRPVQDIYYAQQIIDLRGQYNFNLCYFESNNPTYQNTIVFNLYSAPSSSNIAAANNSIRTGSWYHVVANYGNNVMQLYINGALIGSQTIAPPSPVSGYYNTIGKDYNMDRNRLWFYGSIDEIIFYKRSLTSTEIQALYNRGLASSDIPELYANPTIQYTYDAIGRRTSRNAITLKSAPNIVEQRDSAGIIHTLPEVFEENLGEQKVLIYPNPTQGQLKVEIQGYEKETNTTLYLFDLSGKLLISKKLANNTESLDLSGYSTGTYILKIILGDKTSEWKIIKE